MASKLVSVIIPNYNYAHYLPAAIDSVFGQTYPNLEVIVVDDGSTDHSKEVLAGYGDRVVSVFQQNQGVSAARNNGVRASSGELIAFLDADDVWLPTKVAQQVQRFDNDAALGLVHVGVDEVDTRGNSLITRLDGLSGQVEKELIMLTSRSIFGGGSGLMVPRRVFDEVGGFDQGLSTSADWDIFYQICERYPVEFVPEILLKYRVHDSNMHGNVPVMEHDMTRAFEKAFRRPRPEVAAIKNQAYGRLHQILAASYFVAGSYPSFVRHAVKSLIYNPQNISYFLSSSRRTANQRGMKAEA